MKKPHFWERGSKGQRCIKHILYRNLRISWKELPGSVSKFSVVCRNGQEPCLLNDPGLIEGL